MKNSTQKDFVHVVRNAISHELCNFISTEFRMLEKCVNYMQPTGGKELGLTESFSMYSALFTESLSLHILPIVESYVNKKLFPSYSYGRIYRTGAVLEPHLDRRSSEYTVSCCLDKEADQDWQLVVKRANGDIEKVSLEVGDILIYPGRDLNHWRAGKFKGSEQVQAFIQYVDATGSSADLKWDSRPMMGLPWETATIEVREGLDYMLNTPKEKITDDHLDAALPTIQEIFNQVKNNE